MTIHATPDHVILAGETGQAYFSQTNGKLLTIMTDHQRIQYNGLLFDFGFDAQMVRGAFQYDPLQDKRTWELPVTQPTECQDAGLDFYGFSYDNDRLTARYQGRQYHASLTWFWHSGCLAVDLVVHNTTRETVKAETAVLALQVRIPQDCRQAEAEFPGNVPYKCFDIKSLPDGQVCTSGLVGAVTHLHFDQQHQNIIFLDQEEKWSSSIYRHGNELTVVSHPSVEIRLAPDQGFAVGTLMIQLPKAETAYTAVRDLYDAMGLKTPTDGHREGVLYSCHPAGTMDSGFRDLRTMAEYTVELDRLHALGIDHVWLLPVFNHEDRGVYHPTDQAVLDPRYGTDDDMRLFCDKAHSLGMTVLFDYVPHGPAPHDKLAKDHDDWCSRRADGSLQIEWECVSFDMTNPLYLDYHLDLVKDHVRRFGVDGSRIDCAMGGLSNWRPWPGRRPSSANLRGGILISETIRRAVTEMGVKPLILPENFNPLPQYYSCTDLFYDMPLYRALVEMRADGLGPREMAHELTRWLDRERQVTPRSLVKLRFLGNHDTVSWVFTKARAVKTWGVAGAKALWALFSLIDGMPMLYQGDEDPVIYHDPDGEKLDAFFTQLFSDRKKWLDNDFNIDYLYLHEPVVAFRRMKQGLMRLVLVNLADEAVRIDNDSLGLSSSWTCVAGQADSTDGGVHLPPFAYAVLTGPDQV